MRSSFITVTMEGQIPSPSEIYNTSAEDQAKQFSIRMDESFDAWVRSAIGQELQAGHYEQRKDGNIVLYIQPSGSIADFFSQSKKGKRLIESLHLQDWQIESVNRNYMACAYKIVLRAKTSTADAK